MCRYRIRLLIQVYEEQIKKTTDKEELNRLNETLEYLRKNEREISKELRLRRKKKC